MHLHAQCLLAVTMQVSAPDQVKLRHVTLASSGPRC
eukprot:COSAG02_NODE_29166_length_574_cov_1.852632_1_plen_35_part_10